MECKHLIILCVLLLASLTEGMATPRHGQRCLCKKRTTNIKMKNVSEIEIFPRSPQCEKIEVVATMKGSKKQKCIHPKIVQDIIAGKQKKKNLKGVNVINHIVNA
ncbi:C-X-C motif chemokine 11-like [Pelodytes ibericus]